MIKNIMTTKSDYNRIMRKKRALTQKLYLIEKLPESTALIRSYIVMVLQEMYMKLISKILHHVLVQIIK